MYYKDRDDPTHPRDSKGILNFEVIDAMRLSDLQRDIKKLLKGEEIIEPFFDLSDGHLKESRAKRKLSLKDKNSVLIMEGIFCLNPRLLGDIVQSPNSEKHDDKSQHVSAFRIFMCPIPFFSLDNLNFISEQVVRLVRRISRDNAHRGRNAEGTLFKWGMLQEGEEENMFQLIHNADVVFNSALVYEIAVLNAYSKPLLQTVDCASEQYKDANTLRSFCDSFLSSDGIYQNQYFCEHFNLNLALRMSCVAFCTLFALIKFSRTNSASCVCDLITFFCFVTFVFLKKSNNNTSIDMFFVCYKLTCVQKSNNLISTYLEILVCEVCKYKHLYGCSITTLWNIDNSSDSDLKNLIVKFFFMKVIGTYLKDETKSTIYYKNECIFER
ncbi:hypothetical protein RFI_00599 [Reticulomyxa filosa]|uniref:Phosphoribulokinase/uridine kinase domain-containing protein n=1 Tax=Reticulomyxa filosa TaxID=46433 RepID=X6PED6_RETFI|nr:hypothetical protein RFI_00599 [Reticulomyxa filosa]|eukprot:ETO36463.1 hypothetical protein RFI_00599 [Reticulomyxa filosa]